MFPVLYCRMPGHEFFQFLVGRGFAQVWQHGQYQQEVFIWLNAVGLRRFHQRVDDGTGFRTLDTVTEQPVLSAYRERPYRILRQIIGDGNIPVVQKCELTQHRFGPITGKYVLYRGEDMVLERGITYRNVEEYLMNL